jgi:hypothetical protein
MGLGKMGYKRVKVLPTDFWTPERVAELRALWPTGMFMKDIAKHLGCTKNSIASKSRTLNLTPRRVTNFRGPAKKYTSPFVAVAYKTRSCLKCRKPFESAGTFRCDSCRREAQHIAPMAEGVSA